MTSVPDDAPDSPGRAQSDRSPRDDRSGGGAPTGAVGRPHDAWLHTDGELRYGGRLSETPDPAAGAEVTDEDGRVWSVEGEADAIGEAGVVLEPEPDPSRPPEQRLTIDSDPRPDPA